MPLALWVCGVGTVTLWVVLIRLAWQDMATEAKGGVDRR